MYSYIAVASATVRASKDLTTCIIPHCKNPTLHLYVYISTYSG